MPNSQTVLITGASTGIGADLTRLFAANGFHLVLVARSADKLTQLAEELSKTHGIKARVLPKDLSLPSAASEIFVELQKDSVQIDILVNNAGIGSFGFFAETPLEELQKVTYVNMIALTELTRLFVSGMLERKRGKILNVASTASFQPGPLMAVYYASKAYVLWFSEALANELKGSGVSVTALAPGPTITEFQKRAKMERSGLISGKLLSVMDSESVARYGYRALMKNKRLAIPGFMNKLVAFSTRLAPRKMVTQIARKLQEAKKR
jgi:short-subunit dehydrogenase